MNAQVRHSFYLFVVGFAALVGVLAYWQVYAQKALAENPNNGLQTKRNVQSPRGVILAGDGNTVLARSEKQKDGSYKRVYPEGSLYADVIGYWSQKYGATGIELGENSNLSATKQPETLDQLINQFTGGPQAGNNITLTLDPKLQKVARDQIAQSKTGRGSVVALDPKTGRILALVSYPSYDPNNIDERFKQIRNDPNQPLLNRATQGLYTPGSVMKTVTAAAALKSGVKTSDKYFDSGSYQAAPGAYRITNYGGYRYGQVTFAEAYAKSLNVIFAKVAVQTIHAQALYDMARAFGFGDSYKDFPLPVTPSDMGPPPAEWDGNYLAAAAFGQAQVQTNSFEMAMMTAAIANDGVMMEPQLVKEVRSSDGVILDRPATSERGRVIDEKTAKTLTDMMHMVVTDKGTAPMGAIKGVEVAAKTGTAEVPGGAPNSWYIAFAPDKDPKIAIATLIENGGDGEKVALPATKKIMEEYLKENKK